MSTARRGRTSSRKPRPGRVLAIFLAVIVVLYGVVAMVGDWKPRLGLDLQGGTRIALEAKTSSGDVTQEKLDEARDIIDQRVNGSGISEADVTTQGGDQVVIEIPGEKQAGIVDEVGRTAQLRFRLVWATSDNAQQQPENGSGNGSGNDQQLPFEKPSDEQTSSGSDSTSDNGKNRTAPTDGAQSAGAKSDGGDDPGNGESDDPSGDQSSGDQSSGDQSDDGGDDNDDADDSSTDVDWTELSLDQMISAETEGLDALPPDYRPAISDLNDQLSSFQCNDKSLGKVDDVADEPLVTCDPESGETFLLSPSVIPGTDVSDVSAGVPQNQVDWVVSLELGGDGQSTFDQVTDALTDQYNSGNSAGSRFAIVLDGAVLSAPQSEAHITNGQSQISGDFTQDSAQSLANSLKYGALPLTFGVNSVSVEGPSLAGSQLDAGLTAGAVGLLLVILYSLFYYRGLGLVVIASLLVAAATTYALVLLLAASAGFTLTLPGIAGLIVAIGITADSFVVFFERLRDEVREGRSLRVAVERGWRRARMTIVAADSVSFMAALVLYIFAIGVVRGFAFALGLTTLIDVFIVFFFTKPLVALLARTQFFGQGHRFSGLDRKHLGIHDRPVSQMAKRPASASAGGEH
ncbi:protein translocase subunit SecD [Solicola gregarius]|uniref:Protein translocase subunit SecD n=1 Tax=Solicola gregarius TaxID=2908642 RepID=A0AA46TH90_9ACTN|nr:protein translocase subunit SecD [Solicola gregarius]UYM04804.1 protein translocase subunit SecD [Solicola gregarius]